MASKNRLRSLRERENLSKSDLGAILRPGKPLNPRTIYRWETGESNIPDDHKAALSSLFGVSIAHLMGWDENGNGENGEQEQVA